MMSIPAEHVLITIEYLNNLVMRVRYYTLTRNPSDENLPLYIIICTVPICIPIITSDPTDF